MSPPNVFAEIADRIAATGRPPMRMVEVAVTTDQWLAIGQAVTTTEGTALARAADISVFFDRLGRITGWRDEGRFGGDSPPAADPTGVLEAVVAELGLGSATRLGRVRAVLLPPIGWTIEAGLFPGPLPDPAPAIAVWLNPGTKKVIQCRFEPPSMPG